jgi:molecular chaperone GrpE
MSDIPPPLFPASAASTATDAPLVNDALPAASPLTPEAIARILGNYQQWLHELTALPEHDADEPPIDLHTVVSQFTALRQEVNLQTKATRSSLEQNTETLQHLSRALDTLSKPPTDAAKPLLKAIVDVYDALTLALRQVTKQRESIGSAHDAIALERTIPEPPAIPDVATPALVEQPRGFWTRLFGGKPAPPVNADMALAVGRQLLLDWRTTVLKEEEAKRQRLTEAAQLARAALDGIIAGYQMSINRLDRVLEQAALVPITTIGTVFDPERMEVVEVVNATGEPAGTVVDELRRGYTRDGIVFRYAQVKVAR